MYWATSGTLLRNNDGEKRRVHCLSVLVGVVELNDSTTDGNRLFDILMTVDNGEPVFWHGRTSEDMLNAL